MILFINEERAYRYWVAHHGDGFVLDGRHRPRWGRLVLHRAGCSHIRHAATKRTHWTTGTRFKACSLNRQEIVEWVNNELGRPCERCSDCSPNTETTSTANGSRHLTRLAAQVVDYVLEVAAIHLDEDASPYNMTVRTIAIGMGKSPRQLAATLKRLIDDGYLTGDVPLVEGKATLVRQPVYPTSIALRLLPYFHDLSDDDLNAELGKLRVH